MTSPNKRLMFLRRRADSAHGIRSRDILSLRLHTTEEQHSGSWFLNLPKAEQFYLNIRSLFCPDEAGFLPDIYVFSTTSGLVIREQYLGSNQMKTSPWRRDYFDFFRTSGCRIYYQLDPFSTWAGEKGVLRSQMPVETHQEHLASFLQIPTLELSEVAFDLAETIWRREYTVVSSRGEVAFSSRSPDVKEISEGLIATKKFYEQTGKDPFRTVQSMYDHQISEKQIIKKMHEHLTAEESRQRAAETFRRWHLDMRTAV